MSFSLLKHNKVDCGGNLHLEITDMFTMKTPSASITPDGIFLGVLELGLARTRKPAFSLCCDKCGDSIKRDKFDEEVSVTCMICRKDKPTGEVSTCHQISAICRDCTKFLDGSSTETIPEHIRVVATWLKITQDMKLKDYSDILREPIQL